MTADERVMFLLTGARWAPGMLAQEGSVTCVSLQIPKECFAGKKVKAGQVHAAGAAQPSGLRQEKQIKDRDQPAREHADVVEDR